MPAPLPRTNVAEHNSSTSFISFTSFRLPALELSCLSFSCPRPLFSIVCGLFYENTGGGIPLPDLRDPQVTTRNSRPSCAKTQKCPRVSPLLATLTDSLSRNPFVCHSYANTRGVCTTPRKFLASPLQLSTVGCKLPSALTPFRINTYTSVASKRLYPPLESTLTKKGGEGEGEGYPGKFLRATGHHHSHVARLQVTSHQSLVTLTPFGRRRPRARGRSRNPTRPTRKRPRRLSGLARCRSGAAESCSGTPLCFVRSPAATCSSGTSPARWRSLEYYAGPICTPGLW